MTRECIIHGLEVSLATIMGSAASVPREIDQETFNCLTDGMLSTSMWNSLRPQKGRITKDKFFGFLDELTDVFFTHDWNDDELERDNHVRVSKMNTLIQQQGFKTWFDEEKMKGRIKQKMIDGIDRCACVVVFITKNYISKASGSGENGDKDNCFFEFDHAAQTKGRDRMIPVVMEPSCKDTRNWFGLVGAELRGSLYVDFTSDDKVESAVKDLADKIRSIVKKPLLERYDSPGLTAVPSEVTIDTSMSPVSGDTFSNKNAEIIRRLATRFESIDITPDNAHEYAQCLLRKGIPSWEKLQKIVKKNGKECLRNSFGIDEFDEDDVFDALIGGSMKNEVQEAIKGKNIPSIVRLLSKETTDIESTTLAVAFFLEYSDRDKFDASCKQRAELASEGVIPLLIDMLKIDRVCGDAALALMRIARNDDNEVRIAKEGGIEPLIALLKSGDATGKTNAAGALRNLSFNDDNKSKFKQSFSSIQDAYDKTSDSSAKSKIKELLDRLS